MADRAWQKENILGRIILAKANSKYFLIHGFPLVGFFFRWLAILFLLFISQNFPFLFQYHSRVWTAREIAIANFLQGIGPDDILP
jgi:hypothetical protein